jgi:hypothetical protein
MDYDKDKLNEIVATMRQLGIVSLQMAGVSVTLGPVPHQELTPDEPAPPELKLGVGKKTGLTAEEQVLLFGAPVDNEFFVLEEEK